MPPPPRPPAAAVAAAAALLVATGFGLVACGDSEVQSAYFEAAFQGRCNHGSPCEQLCQDLHDGMFECDCREGFVLHRNGYSCLEMNSTLEAAADADAAAEAAADGTADDTPADGDAEIGADAPADVPADAEEDILYQKDASFSAELDPSSNSVQLPSDAKGGDPAAAAFPVEGDPAAEQIGPRVQFVTTQSPDQAPKEPVEGGEDGVDSEDLRLATTESLEAGATVPCSLDCGAGGACVMEPAEGAPAAAVAPRCQCPLGRGGDRCDAEVEVRSPRFSGQGWLAFPALRAAYKHVQLELEFRPEAWDGILFLTGERDDMAGDFMALLLHRGFVEFRFDCGSGLGVVRSEETVLLNQWNRITVYRHRWDAWIQLNNDKRVEGRSKGVFSRITFREPLFLGGPGNTTGLADKLPTEDGLRGCIRRLEVGDHAYSFSLAPLGDAVKGFDVEECSADRCSRVPCQHGGKCVTSGDSAICLCPLGFTGDLCEVRVDLQVPAFNGSSYLRYPGLAGSALSWLDVQIILKPTAHNGVILYNGRRSDGVGDFIAIYMDDGHLEFTFDLGTGAATIRSAGRATLCAWHELRLSRTGRLAVLQLDREPPAQALAPGAFTQLSLPQSLYIGGVPNFELVSPKVRVRSSFVGCIQKVVVNGRPLQIVSAALGGVNVDNCPHPCAAQPCGRGGQCVPERDSYTCYCGGEESGDGQCPDPQSEDDDDEDDVVPPPPPPARPHAPPPAARRPALAPSADIAVPRFSGHSYLHYSDPDTLRRIVSYKTSINMRFRTRSASGLLLWSGQTRMTPAGDFLALGVSGGHLHFRFNLGGGEVTIVYNATRIDDGLWHRLRAVRYEQEGSLTVDNGPAVSQRAPGDLRQLNTHTGLYLGGLADIEHATLRKYTSGMVGCISDLILDTDYHVQLMHMSTASKNIERCG